jgi:predicted ATP-dependent endonuclease of OLD family
MPVLYFDNFRGFNKTYLPLKKVNFFVGENSSGKTSVLKLIKILSAPRFWFGLEFNSEEAELGYYSEIASYANKTKKHFEVAVLSDINDKKGKGINAIKLKFENKDGVPRIKEIALLSNDINIQAVIDGESVKYRYNLHSLEEIQESDRFSYFQNWVEKNELTNKVFIKDEKNQFSFGEGFFFYQVQVQSVISNLLMENVEKKSKANHKIPGYFLRDVAWLAPIRTDPKRTYDSYKTTFNPDGTHAPYLLKKLLSKENKLKTREKVELILQKFGMDSGLFDKIMINPLGKNDTSPFELQVSLYNHSLKITNVGYGVSQILPLIIEVIARPNGAWFALQQPEIHLHPRGQAAFGDFILKSALNDNKNFIIETHSDYTIDRFRLKLNKIKNTEQTTSFESQIVFFKKTNGINELKCIPINNDGSLPENQPKEFRDFFIKEQLDLLEI